MDKLVMNGLPLSGTTARRPTNAENGQPYLDNSIRSQLVFNDATNTWQSVSGEVAVQVDFVETTGAGTYTGEVAIPAGATITDILVQGDVLWAATTSATLNVGDFTEAGAAIDADGFYTAVNLKATDLLAGESLSFAQSGGKAGVYNAGTNTHWTNRKSSSNRLLRGVVVTVGAAGNTGRTSMIVKYTLCAPFTATKV
jgi:hypothetical protein